MISKTIIIKMIIFYSQIYGVDHKLALAVARNESNFNPNVISSTEDYGVFQLNIKSFPQYNKKQLLNPYINIPEGIKYLAKMKKECKYNKDIEWLICYNYGVGNARKVKYPKLWPYTRKIAAIIEGNN